MAAPVGNTLSLSLFDDSNKWRGGFEDFTDPNAPLIMWDIPNDWLEGIENPKSNRKEILKDMLAWAMSADLIEGFPEIDDELLDQMVISVTLTERGKRVALKAGGGRVVAWAAGLSEHGIQVKLFAKSQTQDQFDVLDFSFTRPTGEYTQFGTKTGKWNYGVISEWRSSLPEVILNAIQN